MHCNLKSPDAAPGILRFNWDAHTKFEVGQPIHSCLIPLRYAVTLTFVLVILTFDPSTWNVRNVYRLWRDQTLYQILAKSIYPRQSYRDLNIWPNDLQHVSLWDNFHQVELGQPIRTWLITFLLLTHCVTLWLDRWHLDLVVAYLCTLTYCRSAWIWLDINTQNSPVLRVSKFTSLPYVKTIGKYAAELLWWNNFFVAF